MITLDEAHVTTVAVDPARHREKIGTRLMLQLAREAIARGAVALTLEVRMSNKAAQDMYRRFGFGPVGVRKNYYQEVNEDALVMWAHEIDQPAYSELLDSIERTVPGETILDGRW
jgi:ribosomal-protein-alanine N-acetyltransferase